MEKSEEYCLHDVMEVAMDGLEGSVSEKPDGYVETQIYTCTFPGCASQCILVGEIRNGKVVSVTKVTCGENCVKYS
jgi:hypothetical protein